MSFIWENIYIITLPLNLGLELKVYSSVADPVFFYTNPAPRIPFVEKQIRILIVIQPKIEKISTF